MRIASLLLITLIASCSSAHDAVAPSASAGSAKPRDFAIEFTSMIPVLGKCEHWDADSVLCKPNSTSILWCRAAKGEKPKCEMAADWTPQPAAEAQPPAPATQPKRAKQ
jgi:hypothetical protein